MRILRSKEEKMKIQKRTLDFKIVNNFQKGRIEALKLKNEG